MCFTGSHWLSFLLDSDAKAFWRSLGNLSLTQKSRGNRLTGLSLGNVISLLSLERPFRTRNEIKKSITKHFNIRHFTVIDRESPVIDGNVVNEMDSVNSLKLYARFTLIHLYPLCIPISIQILFTESWDPYSYHCYMVNMKWWSVKILLASETSHIHTICDFNSSHHIWIAPLFSHVSDIFPKIEQRLKYARFCSMLTI